ncbi:MAG: DUF1501 domain-containing protein [Planctomycetaceae bacterium]|nr:DUF1501 domain-containing protein [Planctomycetaceae bacterium]
MFARSLSRRHFLRDSALIALAPSVPVFLGRTVRSADITADGRILVVIQLDGGNDGINTVIPFADPGYAQHRQELRIADDKLIKLNDQVALHPDLKPLAELLDDGRLAIVQGVGYPNPDRSHDVSMAIWQTARFDAAEHKSYGWLGRALDAAPAPADGAPHSILVTDRTPPVALRGRRCSSVAMANLNDLQIRPGASLAATEAANDADDLLAFTRRATLDARSAADRIDDVVQSTAGAAEYPQTGLADRLKTVAQLIKANFATPVYYAIQSGYDTHSTQLATHGKLLRELAGAVRAFLDDLQSSGLADRVLVMGFSEFGRRVEENASLGTDHGTAGPMFLAGAGIHPGLHQAIPSMTDLVDGDLQMSVDFRSVYAAILSQWLRVDPLPVLGGEFAKCELLKA